MATAQEQDSPPHGRAIPGSGGYTAFVPAPLPPPITWHEELVAPLSSADRAIGRLAGEGRRFRNPHLFISSFLRREAVLSSRIEGTRTTLEELLAAEAGATAGRAPDDLEEVANYVEALEYGLERLETLPISLRLIRELHERLMRGVRGDMSTPGDFRRSQNWIGPPGCSLTDASHVPPPADELMACLDALERFLMAEVACTPRPPAADDLGPDERASQAVSPDISLVPALMAKLLERTCQVRNRVRQSRTLGSVGGGAR